MQKLELFTRFNPFCDGSHAQTVRQRNNSGDNRHIFRIRRKVPDERTVDLQAVNVETFQISQRRITRPEIINGNADTAFVQLIDNGNGCQRVFHGDPFRQFQLQITRFHSGFFQNVHHQFGQPWMAELYGGQVDRYSEIPVPPILPGFQLRHSRSQYPFPYRNDLAVRLGNRDEFIWRDIAELRVLPSDQGFEADNPVVLERKLWLINQTELACISVVKKQ